MKEGPAEQATQLLREGLKIIHEGFVQGYTDQKAEDLRMACHQAIETLKPLVLEERIEQLKAMPELQVLLMDLKTLSPADIELVISKWMRDLEFMRQIQERQRS